MFDVGFWEVAIVILVALLVVGPERLPGLAREIGRFIGKTRRFVNSVRSDIEQELQTEELRKLLKGQEREIQELKSMMQETEDSLRSDLRETEQTLRGNLDDLTGEEPEAKGPARKAKDAEPRVQRVPVAGSLDADLLTDAPPPEPVERKEPAAPEEAAPRRDGTHQA